MRIQNSLSTIDAFIFACRFLYPLARMFERGIKETTEVFMTQQDVHIRILSF